MLYFAYDGTIHGDWVGNYAVQLASRQSDRTLNLIHVTEANRAQAVVDIKLAHFDAICKRSEVKLIIQMLAYEQSVFETIKSALQNDTRSLLVCGTRAGRAQRDILQGTVAERFLKTHLCPTLAIRVNNSGVLGVPSRLLLPIRRASRQFTKAFPVLKLLAQGGKKVSLVCVESVSFSPWYPLTHDQREHLLSRGRDYCLDVEQQLQAELGFSEWNVDAQVIASNDVPSEIVLAANRTKAQLILLGASRRARFRRLVDGNLIEQVLRKATCDVAIYGGA